MEISKQYLLHDFQKILFNGFLFELPEETLKLINEISSEVGSPTYIKTPVFQKKEYPITLKSSSKEEINKTMNSIYPKSYPLSYGSGEINKKKRRGKNTEMGCEEDWETIRTFHTTKMEQKTGSEVHFDNIRSLLNKLTDKNVEDMTMKIITTMETIKKEYPTEFALDKLYKQIFENAFHNRFYSRIYTILYSQLLKKYQTETGNEQKIHTSELVEKIYESIKSIEFVDSSVDYDRFCKINKINEKRKAMCEFLMNFIREKIVDQEVGIEILNSLFNSLFEFISMENKKNEVDEIAELIAVLWKKDFYNSNLITDEFLRKIDLLARSKTKDYLSLTNKTIFKFMDLQ